MAPEIFSSSGPGVIVDCKDPYPQEWILKLNNTPHTRGYTMKVEQRRPRLKPEDIYALAHKNVSKREGLQRLNKGDKTTVTYTHPPSNNKTAVNAVNADATADPNTAEPADTSDQRLGSVETSGEENCRPRAFLLGSVFETLETRKRTEMDYHIEWFVTNSTF